MVCDFGFTVGDPGAGWRCSDGLQASLLQNVVGLAV